MVIRIEAGNEKNGEFERITRALAVNGKWIGSGPSAEAPVDRIGANFPEHDSAEANCLDHVNANE
jgi:hypothetical protein